MALEQDIADLVQASNNLTGVVDNKIQLIDQKVAQAQTQFQQWLDTRHVGFSLTDTLLDHSDSYISIPPRFSTLEEAEAFSFNAAEDYAPQNGEGTESYYADIYSKTPGATNWYSEPGPTQFTGRKSVYANISVGTAPHPSPKPVNRIAVLMNSIGSHHRWITTGDPTPNYAQPRTFMNQSINANREIKGQSYGVTNYDDLMAFHENEAAGFPVGFSTVRVINLGPYPIQIKGFWLIHHGYQKEA
ncbi:hypothetical protein [Thalassomonas actiniarum]|uniref:Uncharacterized protein n=1 Tax=Thalassomonas actiniarum TaxID=485447 RepID=A0AAE9YX87_9GAMM|nr:hypothetical protein [Thalassomonas actiniarum]WDE02074.1 hypothetical protein SG35_024470 [Thalassomonas actiniarum]